MKVFSCHTDLCQKDVNGVKQRFDWPKRTQSIHLLHSSEFEMEEIDRIKCFPVPMIKVMSAFQYAWCCATERRSIHRAAFGWNDYKAIRCFDQSQHGFLIFGLQHLQTIINLSISFLVHTPRLTGWSNAARPRFLSELSCRILREYIAKVMVRRWTVCSAIDTIEKYFFHLDVGCARQ